MKDISIVIALISATSTVFCGQVHGCIDEIKTRNTSDRCQSGYRFPEMDRSVRFVLYDAYSMIRTVRFILCNAYRKIRTVLCVPYDSFCTMRSVRFELYDAYCIIRTERCILCDLYINESISRLDRTDWTHSSICWCWYSYVKFLNIEIMKHSIFKNSPVVQAGEFSVFC